jgi:hypothetical protein
MNVVSLHGGAVVYAPFQNGFHMSVELHLNSKPIHVTKEMRDEYYARLRRQLERKPEPPKTEKAAENPPPSGS